MFHHSRQAESCSPHYISLLHHTVLARASSLLLHRPLCLSLSLTTLPTTILCICVCTCCVHPEMGGWGSGRFHWEQYPFWCISVLFVSLTRTNRPVADRRRMKWREGKSEWGRDERVRDPPHRALKAAWLSVSGLWQLLLLAILLAALWAVVLICSAVASAEE